MKEWKKIYYAKINENLRNGEISESREDKRMIKSRTKKTITGKQGYYIMINGQIQQNDITIPNMYTSTNRASKYIKQ